MTEKLRETLAARPEVTFAILFGSAARGELTPASDVDVAVTLREGIAAWDLGGLAVDLETAAGRPVDLVVLNRVKGALLRHEIAGGVLLKGSDEDFVGFRRMSFREWREFEPRLRRLSDAFLSGQGDQ